MTRPRRTAPVRSGTTWTWIAVLFGTIGCVAVACADAGVIGAATNADMLWPASFMWDVTTRADGWRGHSLSRLPSLFPDVAIWGGLYELVRSVRWTIVLYAVAQLGAFVALGGWIASRLADRPWVVGSAALVAMLGALTVLGVGGVGAAGMVRTALLPIDHFGPLLLGLFGAAFAARPRGGIWVVALVSLTVFLSDQLLLIEFVAPVICAIAALAVAGRMRPSRSLALLLGIGGGVLVGALALAALRRAGMRFDSAPTPHLLSVWAAIGLFFGAVPQMLSEAPVVFVAFFLAVCALAGLGWWIVARARRSVAPRADDAERLFLWTVLALCGAGSIGFTASFYENSGSTRYFVALWACVVIVVAAVLARLPVAPRAAGPVAAATATALLILLTATHGTKIALLRWTYDVAACVRELKAPLDLHAGLAQYWVARPLEVALGFSTQVDQVKEGGEAYVWNNDARWFRESLVDPARPPVYDFVVMRNLDPARITAKYGKPDLVVPCVTTAIWVYRDHPALYAEVTQFLPPTE